MSDQRPSRDDGATVDTSAYVTGLAGPMVTARRRTDRTTKVLVAVLIWAIGFLAGARLQSVIGGLGAWTDDASEPTAEPLSPARDRSGLSSTVGRIKVVDGTVIYVVDEAGTVVKVLTSPESAITGSAPARLDDLRPGDDVVVRGRSQPDGTIAATSVGEVG